MSTKIMIQLHKKYNSPTKNDFDHAIAELFNNASNTILELTGAGNPSYDLSFWSGPKVGTIFEKLSDNTTYRFAVKVLEARDRWIDRERARQTASQTPIHEAPRHESEAAKAIDRFKDNAEVAALASSGVAALMNGVFTETIDFTMSSYMIDQFKQLSDTEDEDLGDDEDPGPAQPRIAKRGMLEEIGTTDGAIEAPAAKRVKFQKTDTTDGDIDFEPALVSDTAKLALGSGAPEDHTGDFGKFLAQLAKEGQAQLDEEDMMEMDGY